MAFYGRNIATRLCSVLASRPGLKTISRQTPYLKQINYANYARRNFNHWNVKNVQNKVIHAGQFKTTQVVARRHLHPIVWFILRPVTNILAMVFGRVFRKWWKSLPQEKQALFREFIARNRIKILAILAVLGFGGVAFYESHIEETPITGRKRFILFTPKQFGEISQLQHEILLAEMKDKIIPTTHPIYKDVARVAYQLLNSNRDIAEIHDRTWKITVVSSAEKNAFVLPDGQIFVFTGMLSVCSSDDELGCVLGHEISHAILSHSREMLSHGQIVNFFVTGMIGLIWAVMPSDIIALIVQYLSNKILQIYIQLPYDRYLEAEADEVGIKLAAKSCFDIRAGSAFWAKMKLVSDQEGGIDIEFLSTHPSHESRAATLDEMMPKMFELMKECKCPPLPPTDPRLVVEQHRIKLQEAEKIREQTLALPLRVAPQG